MPEKANKFERNVSPAKPDAARAFERLTSTEPLYDARLTELAAQPNRIKNNRAFRLAQLLALTFALTTSLAERTVAQETITPKIEASMEDADHKKFEGMRTVFHTELAHLKALGYEIVPSRDIFEFKRDDKAGLSSTVAVMSEDAAKFRKLYDEGRPPMEYEVARPHSAAANRLAMRYATFAKANSYGYENPLHYIQQTAGGTGEIPPEFERNDVRSIGVPMLSFSTTIQGGATQLTVRNWLNTTPPEVMTFSDREAASEYLLAKYAEEVKRVEEYTGAMPPRLKENWNFAVYPDKNRTLNSTQKTQISELFGKINFIAVHYEPQGRAVEADMYGTSGSMFGGDRPVIKITKSMFDDADNHPLILNRKITRMSFELKPELSTTPADFVRTYEMDKGGNLVAYIRTRSEEHVSIQPRLVYCEDASCEGEVTLDLDLRKIHLPQINGIFYQEKRRPIGNFVQHGPLKLFSGYSKEVVDRRNESRSTDLVNGISRITDFFGMTANAPVKGIYFSDIYSNERLSGAGVDPQAPEIIAIQPLRRGDYIEGIGRHETIHSIDMKLKISDDPRFVAFFNRIQKDQPAFFHLLNESNFFKEDGAIAEFGHSEKDPWELFASLVHGLHASRWQEKVGAFTDEQRAIYKDTLTVVRDILREKAIAGLLAQDAPIFADIENKLSKLP